MTDGPEAAPARSVVPEAASGSLAAHARQHVERLLQQHAAAGSTGADPYHDDPAQYHAMADAKYLLALAAMLDARLLSRGRAAAAAAEAVARLQRADVGPGDQAAWGLGFAYDGTPADRPFVITTVLVAEGLLVAHAAPAADLLDGVAAFLADVWRHHSDDAGPIRLPHYAPTNPNVVTNVVAKWGALAARLDANVDGWAQVPAQVRDWLLERYVSPFGWSYAAGSSRYDLLHEGYILNALIDLDDSPATESRAVDVVHMFRRRIGFREKIDITSRDDAIAAATRNSSLDAVPLAAGWLIEHDAPARWWSLGEILLVLARMSTSGQYAARWTQLLRATAVDVIERLDRAAEDGDEPSPRHAMHVAHGLAATLGALRAGGAS